MYGYEIVKKNKNERTIINKNQITEAMRKY